MSNYEPTLVRKFSTPTDPEKVSLASLEVGYRVENSRGGGTKKQELGGIKVYRAACGRHDDLLYMLDIVCAPMEFRAVHACLTSNVTAKFRFRGSSGISLHRSLEREKTAGYRTYIERFNIGDSRANSKIHYLAISNHPSFLPVVEPISVAYKLNGTEFSTPFLSPALHGPDYNEMDWVPYMMDEMIRQQMLVYLDCHNACSGFIHGREATLQQIISDGVRKGILPWPKFDPREIYEANKDQEKTLQSVVAVDEMTDNQFLMNAALTDAAAMFAGGSDSDGNGD